jgi:protein gp37
MLRYLTTPVEGSLAGRFTVDGQPASDAYVRVFSRMVESYPNVQPDALNRATDWLDSHFPDGDGFLRAWPLPNVWLGVSVEHQQAADDRIPFLLQTPAAVRFLSCEPLLGPVKLPPECFRHFVSNDEFGRNSPLIQKESRVKGYSEVPDLLHWIIVGGESGPGARPMHPDWVRSIRDQCQAAGVPFFFKQWGEFADLTNDPPGSPLLLRSTETHVFTADGEVLGAGCRDQGMVSPDWREKGGAWMARVGKKAAGHLLDGREWREWPDGLR